MPTKIITVLPCPNDKRFLVVSTTKAGNSFLCIPSLRIKEEGKPPAILHTWEDGFRARNNESMDAFLLKHFGLPIYQLPREVRGAIIKTRKED